MTSYGYQAGNNQLTYQTNVNQTRYFNTNTDGDIDAYTGSHGVTNALACDGFGRLRTPTRNGQVTTYKMNAFDQRVGIPVSL